MFPDIRCSKLLPIILYLIVISSIISNNEAKQETRNNEPIRTKTNKEDEDKCANCRLTSDSMEGLIRMPRQMNSYGQFDDRIDLEKIKKRICTDISNDLMRERCRQFYFQHLSTIQNWKHQSKSMSFFDYVCIKELKYCCPRNSFGLKCTKCNECNLNEHCHGEGTRQGNGSCVCKDGHTGSNCNSCLKGYYLEKNSASADHQSSPPVSLINKRNSKISTCKPCHKSCLYCRQEGPLGCEVCRSGYTWLPAYGCSDIDECINSNNKICGDNTFCVNTEGSYFCYECDRGCNGCHGDGPDMCLKCANGYKLDNGNCVALKKTIIPPEANYYRYAIYTGLLICACIIFHNNIYLASIIGLIVALYISFSEYLMSTHLQEMQSSRS